MNDFTENIFPRELTSLEKQLLNSVLPEKKPGYMLYRENINKYIVAGKGQFGENNLILCPNGNLPDETIPLSPVFALGAVIYSNNKADIVIHEEIDNQLEFDISFDNEEITDLNEIKRWSYSEWVPGNKAPEDASAVREIVVGKNKYVLVIAPANKKIWLYEYESGVNYIIPVTNLYSYLMLAKKIRHPDIVLKPALFFASLDKYSDEDLITAFIAYNKYFKRIKLKS